MLFLNVKLTYKLNLKLLLKLVLRRRKRSDCGDSSETLGMFSRVLNSNVSSDFQKTKCQIQYVGHYTAKFRTRITFMAQIIEKDFCGMMAIVLGPTFCFLKIRSEIQTQHPRKHILGLLSWPRPQKKIFWYSDGHIDSVILKIIGNNIFMAFLISTYYEGI